MHIQIPVDRNFDEQLDKLKILYNSIATYLSTLTNISPPLNLKSKIDISNQLVVLIGLLSSVSLDTKKSHRVVQSIIKIRSAQKSLINRILSRYSSRRQNLSDLSLGFSKDYKDALRIMKNLTKLTEIFDYDSSLSTEPIRILISLMLQNYSWVLYRNY
jgi:hypothetical protein